jgi:hypothetical protein
VTFVRSAATWAPFVIANAQIAGSTVRAVATAEVREVAKGWSARRQVLGRPVFQRQRREDRNSRRHHRLTDKVGLLAIVGVGGFLSVTEHDVAVSVDQFSD